MHATKQIRDAIITFLTGLPATGDRVGDSVWPEPITPSLRVLFIQELIPEGFKTADRVYTRLAEFNIEIRVTGSDYQDQIDQIRFEVEEAIEADDTLGLIGVKIELGQTGPGEIDDSADISQAFMPIRYVVHYRTTAADPGTLID